MSVARARAVLRSKNIILMNRDSGGTGFAGRCKTTMVQRLAIGLLRAGSNNSAAFPCSYDISVDLLFGQ